MFVFFIYLFFTLISWINSVWGFLLLKFRAVAEDLKLCPMPETPARQPRCNQPQLYLSWSTAFLLLFSSSFLILLALLILGSSPRLIRMALTSLFCIDPAAFSFLISAKSYKEWGVCVCVSVCLSVCMHAKEVGIGHQNVSESHKLWFR